MDGRKGGGLEEATRISRLINRKTVGCSGERWRGICQRPKSGGWVDEGGRGTRKFYKIVTVAKQQVYL